MSDACETRGRGTGLLHATGAVSTMGGKQSFLCGLARFSIGTMTLMKNKLSRRHNTAWTAATRGMGSTSPGRSSGTAVSGSSSEWKMQQGHGREKVRSLHEIFSTPVSPKTYFPRLIVRSITELGSVEVLKYKHLKTTS